MKNFQFPKFLFFSLFLVISCFFCAKNEILAQQKTQKKLKNTKEIVDFIQKKQKKWHKKYFFTQINEYPNELGEITRTDFILEYLQSPNTLVIYPQTNKIQENEKKQDVVTKLHNDTLYNFVNGKFFQKLYYPMPLVWLSCGLGSYKMKEVLEKLKKLGIDIEKTYQDNKNLVIGASNTQDITSPQVHYDAEKGFLKRVLIPNYKYWQEAVFENQQAFGKGWIETKVTIFKDKKVLIVEKYSNIKAPETAGEIKDFDIKINPGN